MQGGHLCRRRLTVTAGPGLLIVGGQECKLQGWAPPPSSLTLIPLLMYNLPCLLMDLPLCSGVPFGCLLHCSLSVGGHRSDWVRAHPPTSVKAPDPTQAQIAEPGLLPRAVSLARGAVQSITGPLGPIRRSC